jgi:hypothetical protein
MWLNLSLAIGFRGMLEGITRGETGQAIALARKRFLYLRAWGKRFLKRDSSLP